MPTLQEIKDYLGIDGGHSDPLILSQLQAARELVDSILRYQIALLSPTPSIVNEAIKFAVGYMFTHRESGDFKQLEYTLKSMLASLRKEAF